MPEDYEICPECFGVGSHQDISAGIIMGTILGTGYMPQTRICLTCNGTGRVKK